MMKRLLLILWLALATCAGAQSQNDLPTQFDLVMLAGADYTLSIKNTDTAGAAVNITGYQFAAQFRAAPAPAGALFATYSTAITNAPAGQFKVTLSKAQTTKLSGQSGIWDLLQIDAAGKATYLLTGKAAVRATATR